jgi:hypothetical protein
MKTTIDIPDSLLKQVEKLASQEHTTVRALVEKALMRIAVEHERTRPFKLRKVSFRGKGLQPQMASASGPQIRGAAYEGRGA